MDNRILTIVVDDDPSVCRALRRLLQTADMDVDSCASGEDFLQTARLRDPDCLVLDIRMPGMSGPELRDRLHAMGRPIPVIFITAHADGEDDAAGGGSVVLRKPFDDQLLLEAIRSAVSRGGG